MSDGWIGEILCCVVVGIFSTIFLYTKRDGVWIFCFVRFLGPLRVYCVFIKVEFKLLLPFLSINIKLSFKGVVPVMRGATVAVAALEKSQGPKYNMFGLLILFYCLKLVVENFFLLLRLNLNCLQNLLLWTMLGFSVDQLSLIVIIYFRWMFHELNLKIARKGWVLVLVLHVQMFEVVIHIIFCLILTWNCSFNW